jgi:hypothetical protein
MLSGLEKTKNNFKKVFKITQALHLFQYNFIFFKQYWVI